MPSMLSTYKLSKCTYFTLHFQKTLIRYCLLLRSLRQLQDPQEYYVPNIKIEMYILFN